MSFTLDTELLSVTRRKNSTNGNPSYELHTTDGNYRTQIDAAINYEVDNIVRKFSAGESLRVTLHMTMAEKVWDIIVAEYQGTPAS